MAAEGTLLIIAGSESVGSALTSLHFHLLEHPDKYNILQEELKKAIPDESRIPRWSKLKELPYLTACIEENLRITNPGVVHRLARLAPRDGLKYGEYNIPAGVSFILSQHVSYLPLSLVTSFLTISRTLSTPRHKELKKKPNPPLPPTTFDTYIDSYKHELIQHAHEPHNFPFPQKILSRALARRTRQQPQRQKQ